MIQSISVSEAKHYLQNLDLHYLAQYMCDDDYSLPRWEYDAVKEALMLYKRFLFLQKKNMDKNLVPTRDIDECWHNHILHTKNYHHDCANIFGFYLHHAPAIKSTYQILVANYEMTKKLYFEEYGEKLYVLS